MSEHGRPAKAVLVPVTLPDTGQSRNPEVQAKPTADAAAKKVVAQFNPETLRLSQAVALDDKKQSGAAAIQHVSTLTRKLAVDLWFDVTSPELLGSGQPESPPEDVRKITEKLNIFLVPTEGSGPKRIPVAVRFQFGSFVFDGVMQSANETIDYFSPLGVPLRAKVAITISSQRAVAKLRYDGGLPEPGVKPTMPVEQGDSVQAAANRAGLGDDWPDVAARNGIENPRQPRAGSRLRLPGRREIA